MRATLLVLAAASFSSPSLPGWIVDDWAGATAQARKEQKPLFVVFR